MLESHWRITGEYRHRRLPNPTPRCIPSRPGDRRFRPIKSRPRSVIRRPTSCRYRPANRRRHRGWWRGGEQDRLQAFLSPGYMALHAAVPALRGDEEAFAG